MTKLWYHKLASHVVHNKPRPAANTVGLRILASLFLGLGACGQVPADQSASDQQTPLADAVDDNGPSTVTTASAHDIATGLALAGSYIVTFRSAGSGDRLNFSSYHAKYQQHYLAMIKMFTADRRIKDVQFLSAVDLTATAPKIHDPFWDLEFGLPPALRRAWQQLAASDRTVGSMFRVDFSDEDAAATVLQEWNTHGRIWLAEPNYISQLSNMTTAEDTPLTSFDDLATRYEKELKSYWWSSNIDLPNAYRTLHQTFGNKPDSMTTAYSPIIAVLDSGVDYEHPALKDKIWQNTDVGAAACDRDEHGCNTTVSIRGKLGDGEVHPYDTDGPGESCLNKDANCSHGTHVAGIIAGDSNWKSLSTGERVAGVCPVCKLMIVKIVGKVGKQSGILDSSILAAFEYVSLFNHDRQSAVRVLNASFGKFIRSRQVGLLVRIMKERRGMILIGAAGNEDTLRMEYPGAFSDAIAVAAVDANLRKVAFSNFGRWVDLSAPGSAILSSVPGQGVEKKSGTSMAAPFVSGVAGLMLAADPSLSFDGLKTWLLRSADPSLYRADRNDGFNYTYYYPKIEDEEVRQPLLGNGVLQANNALLRQTTEQLPIFTDMDRVQPGCSIVNRQSSLSSWVMLTLLSMLPLLDGCLPRKLKRLLKGHDVKTVTDVGL